MKKLTAVQNKVCALLLEGFDTKKVHSVAELLISVGYLTKPNGRILKEARQFLLDNDVDISHFTNNGSVPAAIEIRICPVCEKPFSHISYHKEKTTCSYSCANTYFRSGKDHPNYKEEMTTSNYRPRALAIYENKCVFCSETEVLEVHHIDENRDNNELDNLIVVCPTHHTKIHRGLLKL
jgi:hypothetical protein